VACLSQCLGRHPQLDSFPTRRSSDLAEAGEPVGLALAEIAPDGTPAAELLSLYVAQPARGQGLATMLVERLEGELRSQHVARLRSEEHTSELQSRENLVCRLLLEKKN